MNHTPEISFDGGMLRALDSDDVPALLKLYQQQVMPGQKALVNEEQAERMITLAMQMASQQRGIMWALEVEGQLMAVLSLYDWRPSLLKTQIRLDAFDELALDIQQQALKACIKHCSENFHLRNFIYHYVAGQPERNKQVMQNLGFEFSATLRDFWRTGQESFVAVEQFNLLLAENTNERAGGLHS